MRLSENKLQLKDIFLTILVFMYVFMFRVFENVNLSAIFSSMPFLGKYVPVIVCDIDSSIIAAVVGMFYLLLHQKAGKHFLQTMLGRPMRRIYFLYLLIVLWSGFVVFANGTKDFSFVKPALHGLIQIVIGIIIFSVIEGKDCENKITNYLIVSFVLQTLIEWGAMISPTIKEFVYSTKSESTIRIADQYSGIRGLSLAGSSFFGLAVAFGFIYILFLSEKNTLFKGKPAHRLLLLMFLVSGTFFAGRTGLIGFALVLFYMMWKWMRNSHNVYKKQIIEVIAVGCFVGIMLIVAMKTLDLGEATSKRLGYLYNYVGELFISASSGNGFQTTSSTEMFTEMYFRIPMGTLLVGDGMYTAASGGYYMATDVGYMRSILYGGLPLFLFLCALQNRILKLKPMEKNIYILTWIYFLVCQAKGETIGFTLLAINMFTLFGMQSVKVDSEKDEDG